VTGIPIDNKFETPINQKQWLIDNNLDPDKQTILMSAGAFGVSKLLKNALALCSYHKS
jgi:processive 1,2-diacylglycerol beta-glucosyltransferase